MMNHVTQLSECRDSLIDHVTQLQGDRTDHATQLLSAMIDHITQLQKSGNMIYDGTQKVG